MAYEDMVPQYLKGTEALGVWQQARTLADEGKAAEGSTFLEEHLDGGDAKKFLIAVFNAAHGLGGEEDIIRWLAKTEGCSEFIAMASVGFFYVEHGENEEEIKKGIRFLEKAANAEDKEAEKRAADALGKIYYNGGKVPEDPDRAVYWIRKGAERGALESMVQLGTMYLNGDLVPEDTEMGKDWLRKAADKQSGEACFILGQLAQEEGHSDKSTYWMKKGAALGYSECQLYVGGAMAAGATLIPGGLRKNEKEGLELLKKSAAQGNTKALYVLGLYYKGEMGRRKRKPDYRRAVTYFGKAWEGGMDLAAVQMAVLYLKGTDIPKDVAKAMSLLEKAAAHGNGSALLFLAILYADGKEIPQNKLKAEEILRRIIFINGEEAELAQTLLERLKTGNWISDMGHIALKGWTQVNGNL